MRNEDRVRIRHMMDAAHEAITFVAGRDRPALDSDRMLLLSLVKCVEILGEAASRVSFVTASVFYTLLPIRKIAFRNALRGGLFTAIFLEAARHLFTVYVASVATEFGAIYGPLSSFVIFLLWVYYAASIFLIGAELVCIRELSGRRLR